MVFSSLIFVFVFFVIYLVAYRLVSDRHKNAVLLVVSLVFYAWGGPEFLLLLVGETFVSWLCAVSIGRAESPGRRRAWLIADLAIMLGLLAYFKYAMWIAGTLQGLFGVPESIPNIVLPIGISFYTFQLISYTADVYMGKVEYQPAYWKLLLYSSLFFQCIAGPIVRYETVADDIDNRRVTQTDVYAGTRRFCIGLAKKAVLANACASVADTLLPVGTDGIYTQVTTGLWVGMLFYMLQIYFDFSAYSDMAIGMGRMVGFRFLENFDYPYLCTSVKDFWRRWHISLSTFFRDYVYIPLGGSRCSTLKWVRNMFVVWFLTGLWHGASWNYILWGLYFFVFLLLERFVIRDRMPRALSHVYALVVVFFGWVLFKFENFAELGSVVAGLLGFSAGGFSSMEVETILLQNVFLLVFCVIACTDLGRRVRFALHDMARTSNGALAVYQLTEFLVPIVLLAVSVIALTGASYNPFIYFQF